MKRRKSAGLVFLIFLAVTSLMNSSASAAVEFCNRTADDIKQQATDPEQRLSFANEGGLFNGGVCWWHSRFQRNSLYLAQYRPELEKPSREAAFALIRSIRHFKVVEIPGYENLAGFSSDFQDLIQTELNRWQLDDGVVGFAWIDGLEGKIKDVDPSVLKNEMDALFNRVVIQKEIVFQKLPLPGISAHAWLVIDMIPQESDYQVKVIDSNYPDETKTIYFHMGDTHIVMDYTGWTFIPEIDQLRDLPAIEANLHAYCSSP